MKNKKQSILIATGIGLIASIAVAVYSTNNNSLLNSLAGGLVNTSEKGRTLTLDSTTPLEIDGTVGTLTVGTISLYTTNCSYLENGLLTTNASNCNMYLYCSSEGINANKEHYGFSKSTIESISITLNSKNSSKNITFAWAKFKEDFTSSESTTKTSKAMTATNENQTITFDSSDLFINSQSGAKDGGYQCVKFYTASYGTVDIISLTVEYSCN